MLNCDVRYRAFNGRVPCRAVMCRAVEYPDPNECNSHFIVPIFSKIHFKDILAFISGSSKRRFHSRFPTWFYEFLCSTHAEHLTNLTFAYIMSDEAGKLQRVYIVYNFDSPFVFPPLSIGHAGCFLSCNRSLSTVWANFMLQGCRRPNANRKRKALYCVIT